MPIVLGIITLMPNTPILHLTPTLTLTLTLSLALTQTLTNDLDTMALACAL